MRKIKKSGKFSILAVLLVLSLLMSASLVFADSENPDPDSDPSQGSSSLVAGSVYAIESISCEISKRVEGSVPDGLDPFEFNIMDYTEDSKVAEFTLAAGTTKTIKSLDEGQYYLAETNQGDWDVAYNYPGNKDYFELAKGVVGIMATFSNTGGLEGPLSNDPANPSATYEIYYSPNDFNMKKDLSRSDVTCILGPKPILPNMFVGVDGSVSYSYPDDTDTPLAAGYYGFIIKHHLDRDRTGEDANKQFPMGTIPITDSQVFNPVSFDVVNTFEEDYENKVIVKKFIDETGGSTDVTSFPMQLLVLNDDTGNWDPYDSFDVDIFEDDDDAYEIADLPVGNYKLQEIIFGDGDTDGVADLDSNFDSVQYTLNGQSVTGDGVEFQIDEYSSEPQTIEITVTNKFDFTNKVIVKKFIDETGGSTGITEFPMQLWFNNDGEWVLYNDLNPNPFNVEIYDADDGNAYVIENLPVGIYKLQEVVGSISDPNFQSVHYTLNGQSVAGGGVEFEITQNSSQPQTIEISVTNKFKCENKLIIKKFIDETGGSTSLTSFPVQLWYDNDGEWALLGDLNPNPFNVEIYNADDGNAYVIENLPAGHYKLMELVDQVENSDSDFNSVQYAVTGGSVVGNGNEAYVEFYIYDTLVPTYMTFSQVVVQGPNLDIKEVSITNKFDKELPPPPHYPNLIIEKKIGTGSTSQDNFTVQLQKEEYEQAIDSWHTVATYEVPKNGSKTISMKELLDEYGSGNYRIIELVDNTCITDWSKINSVSFKVDDGSLVSYDVDKESEKTYSSASFQLHEELEADVTVTVTNNYKDDPPTPEYPDLVIKKTIGTGSTSQDYFTVELQKEEYERQAGDNWDTKETYSVPKNGSKTISIKDLVDNYGSGNYRVVELVDSNNIDDWSKFKSVYFTVDGESRIDYSDKNASIPFASTSFVLHEELEKDVTVTVTNNFESGGGSSDDPYLIIKKVIGNGSTDQNNFTVVLQIEEDGAWEDVEPYTIPKNGSKRINLKNFTAGDYRIIETGTEDIEDLISFSYTVNGTDYDSEAPFEVVRGSSKNITVTVTNNFGDKGIIIHEPEPLTPEIITVPVELPELPKTGAAAPIAGGLGLLLAAGGLAINRIKK